MTAVIAGVVEPAISREDVLDAMERRVTRQREALLALTANSGADCENIRGTLSHITEVVSATLDVPRVSIWRHNDARTAIDCVELFERQLCRHSSGASLLATDFPNYFRAIAESDIVAVDDAVADRRTAEFAAPYLRPLGIGSMMDVAIRLGGAIIGVLCHEQTGRRRQWTDDEKAFAIGTSTLISLALERCERSRAESALELQGAALNAAADGIVITDIDGTIVWVNPAFTQLTGHSAAESIGRNPRDLVKSGQHDPAFYAQMWSTLKKGQVWRGEMLNRRSDGTVYSEDQSITPVMSNGRITHFVAIKRDLTDRRNLEAQFHQAQKMEVVGRLAGGIAHDFNNMLTVINGTADLALCDLANNHPLRRDFASILDAGNRATGLTRQLLAFSRKQIAHRAPLAIGPALTGFRSMLQRLIGEDIQLEVAADAAGSVLADQSQIEQVILNLAVNARDAMPCGGKLLLEAADVELDEPFAAQHTGVKPGPHVRIVVRDFGHGMSESVLKRIFEPFFTTKDAGKGTGLGLATVYGIVGLNDGTIWVESQVNHGTTFTIYLPRIGDAAPVAAAIAPANPLETARTVLIVDVDDPVRDVTARILRAAGYVTLQARQAIEALQVLAMHDGPIALIITDVVLTGMGGGDLAARALAIRPDIPILFTSGHTDGVALTNSVQENLVAFLHKPFSADSLLAKVRQVLDSSEGEQS